MVEDYQSSSDSNNIFIRNKLFNDIRKILKQHNKKLCDFDFPQMIDGFGGLTIASSIIEDELSIPISNEDESYVSMLNSGQLEAFNTIKDAILKKENYAFFVDGPGGGRTAHSKFKIPILLEPGSKCRIKKQSDLSELIRVASTIIWDEAPMAYMKALEAVDKTFRFLLDEQLPFGGKIMIRGGDFRQVLPVVLQGSREQTIMASIVQSSLWRSVQILRLHQNMRAHHDHQFSQFLLGVGNGDEPVINNNMIRMPDSMVIPWEGEESIARLIEHTFPDLADHAYDADYRVDRAIITPLNEDVNKLNEKVIQCFPGEEATYYSFDSVGGDMHNLYQQEFLYSLTPGNFPPHNLTLKKGSPIMLLRNIDPKAGLCNGTCLLCRSFSRNVIDAEILIGQYKGTRVFLPRIPLKTTEDIKLPFDMTRRTFPVHLSFSITINKSQGQTIPNVGIYLPNHVFSHGQLYIAISRGVSSTSIKILIRDGIVDGEEGIYTRYVVYKEIFSKLIAHVTP